MDTKQNKVKAAREEIFSLLQYRMLLSLVPVPRIYSLDYPEERPGREEALMALHDLLQRGFLVLEGETCCLTAKGRKLVLPTAYASVVLKIFLLPEINESRILYLGDSGCLSVRFSPSGEVCLGMLSEDEISGEFLPVEEVRTNILTDSGLMETDPFTEEYTRLSASVWPSWDAALSVWQERPYAAALVDRIDLYGSSHAQGPEPERIRYLFLQKTYDSYLLIQTENENRLVRDRHESRQRIWKR